MIDSKDIRWLKYEFHDEPGHLLRFLYDCEVSRPTYRRKYQVAIVSDSVPQAVSSLAVAAGPCPSRASDFESSRS